MKCDTPALASVSSREPAPIQNPMATERTLGIRSEMTRSPESSSERTYFCTTPLSLAGQARRVSGSLADAEGIPLRVPHDRERDVRADLRLDHRGPRGRQPFDFGLAVVALEVEVDRVGLGPGLLAALKEKAWASAFRLTHEVEARDLALVYTRVAERP